MHPDHPSGPQTLGAGELDIILVHRLTRAGAGQADHQADLEQRQVQGGHGQVAEPVAGKGARLDAEKDRRIAPPGRRQPPEHDRKQYDHHQSDPEGRQREAEDRAGHDPAGDRIVRIKPGEKTERYADQDRQDQSRQRQFHGRGHVVQDQLQCRLAEDEGPAKIARGHPLQKVEILLADRPVEPEGLDRALDLRLVRLRIDQHVDRVADDVDAEKDDQRHQKDNQGRLKQAANNEHCHVPTPPSPAAGWTPGPTLPGRHSLMTPIASVYSSVRAMYFSPFFAAQVFT